MPSSNGTACSSPTTARMSVVEPSSDVPMACITYRTRSWAASRRWIAAMYSEADASARPSEITVRSAVATRAIEAGLPGLAGAAVRAADGRRHRGGEAVAARARVEGPVLRPAGAPRLLVGRTAPDDGPPARG